MESPNGRILHGSPFVGHGLYPADVALSAVASAWDAPPAPPLRPAAPSSSLAPSRPASRIVPESAFDRPPAAGPGPVEPARPPLPPLPVAPPPALPTALPLAPDEPPVAVLAPAAPAAARPLPPLVWLPVDEAPADPAASVLPPPPAFPTLPAPPADVWSSSFSGVGFEEQAFVPSHTRRASVPKIDERRSTYDRCAIRRKGRILSCESQDVEADSVPPLAEST